MFRNYEALLKEKPAANKIPYTVHIGENLVKTQNAYVMAFKFQGVGFENADDETLNTWHQQLNTFYCNIASQHISVWSTVVRQRDSTYPNGQLQEGFARRVNDKYKKRITSEKLMVNDLYLALVYRPQPDIVGKSATMALKAADKRLLDQEHQDALEECQRLHSHAQTSLSRYQPELLGIYKKGEGYYSSLYEYFGLLLNGIWQPMPLSRSPAQDVLATSRTLFGTETMEYRTATETKVSAFLSIKEYPKTSSVGMFDGLLSAPFEFVLTQSFTFIEKSKADKLLERLEAQMANAGDSAETLAADLKDARDQLASGTFVMGDHHLSLQVQSELFEGLSDKEETFKRLRQLNKNISAAQTIMSESATGTGMTLVREDVANEAAYWAQLPGNFFYRPRLSPITSLNFAGMMPLHNFPPGRATGNHWGDAMTVFSTNAGTNYFFSFHSSDPKEEDGGSKKDVSHAYIGGSTSSGKTTFLGFMIIQLLKFAATVVLFDKDYGLEILVRALRGCYLPILKGQRTGFNPLRLEPNPVNTTFIKSLLMEICRREGKPLTDRQKSQLDHAIAGTMALDPQYRRLSRLLSFLDETDTEGLYERLSPWCEITREGKQGEYAWIFDNDEDEVVEVMGRNTLIGFDITQFIDDEEIKAPITMYLFHLVQLLQDGRRGYCIFEEFSKTIGDKAFAKFGKEGLERWRKNDWGCAFVTQSTSTVNSSEIARVLIENTATKILFPNEEAQKVDYIDSFGATEREYILVKEVIEPGSRQFIVKQAKNSVVCELDLKGFNFELDVISGRKKNVQIVRDTIGQVGDDPDDWLPLYEQRLLSEKGERA